MNSKLTRRNFFKGSVATATVMGFPVIIPATAFGANDRIALGCIGVGRMGTGNMRGFLGLDACRVTAVCDVQRANRERAKKLVDENYEDTGCVAYNDFRELIARKDIDAVMIAAQDHWHSLIATAAAAAGKDMYCEKPTGLCVRDGQVIRSAVRKNKRVFQSGMWQRSLGNFRQGAELALNGYLGKLKEIQVAVPGGNQYKAKYEGSLDPQPVPDGVDWKMWQGPAREHPFNPARIAHPNWYLINDYCEGWTTNWGVHHLDIAHWGCPALGEGRFEVECSGTRYDGTGFADNVETWRAVFVYPNGLRMVFTDNSQMPSGTKFIGENGWVYVNRGDKIEASSEDLLKICPKDGDARLLPEGSTFDDIATLKTKAGERVSYRNVNHKEGLLNSMRSRKEALSNVDATHTASTLGMVAGIANRLNAKLIWDWSSESFVDNDEANKLLVRSMHNGWEL